jgi:anti-anti-sigma factor
MSVRRQFVRHFDSLPEIFACTADFYGAERVPDAARFAVDFAIEELFTNMVKYGGQGSPAPITLNMTRDAAGLEVVLIDPDSEPFDVTVDRGVDVNATLAERHPGGLGLHLIRRVVDDLDYQYSGRQSRITFRKQIGATMFEISHGAGGQIVLRGRLDASQCEAAQTFLDAVAAPAVLDLGGLEYISSAGLGVLLKTQKRAVAGGGGLRLTNVNPHIHDIFRFSGFDQIFQIEAARG